MDMFRAVHSYRGCQSNSPSRRATPSMGQSHSKCPWHRAAPGVRDCLSRGMTRRALPLLLPPLQRSVPVSLSQCPSCSPCRGREAYHGRKPYHTLLVCMLAQDSAQRPALSLSLGLTHSHSSTPLHQVYKPLLTTHRSLTPHTGTVPPHPQLGPSQHLHPQSCSQHPKGSCIRSSHSL